MTKRTPKPNQPKDAKGATLADLCKLTGLSQGRIAQAVKEGHVTKTGRGLYSVAQAIKGLFSFFDSHWGKLPTYDNVEQCSEVTGIPVSLIKSVRRRSKEPFKNQRIHLGPLLKEIFSDTGDGETNWKDVREKYDALFAKTRAEKAMELALDKEEVEAAISKAVALFWFNFDRLAELEAPAALKGKDETGIREGLKEAGRKLKAQITEALKAYFESGEKEATKTERSKTE